MNGNCGYSTAPLTGRLIEIWRDNFSSVPARSGSQFAELNAEESSRISQSVCLVQGETVGWNFSHRGRPPASATTPDLMHFLIGNQEIVRVATAPDGQGSIISTTLGTSSRSLGPNGWADYTGSFVYSDAGGQTNIGFGSLRSGSYGNFIDEISVQLKPFIEFTGASFSSMEGERPGEPTVRIAGIVPAGGLQLHFSIDTVNSTAIFDEDYELAGGATGNASEFTITVPAGDYGTGAPFTIGLQSLPDGLIEGSETVVINLLGSPSQDDPAYDYIVDSTRVCGDNPVTSTTWTIRDAAPGLTLEKTATRADTNGDNVPSIDDIITYTFTVTNTGNVDIDELEIVDAMFVSPSPVCLATSLAVGASTTCSATHTVVAGDMTAGNVTNTATAQGLTPSNVPVISNESIAVVPLAQSPSIELIKTGSHNDGNRGYASVGDVVTYTFTITNTGNVTLTGVTLTDPRISGAISGMPIASLAPGATVTRTATYALTQLDINAGSVANTATVTGQPPVGGPVTDDGSTTVRLVQAPRLSVEKTAGAPTGHAAGQTITYTFVVRNLGNVPVSNVTIADPQLNGAQNGSIACGTGTLAIGASRTCTGTHTITQAEIDAGVANNTARANGETPSGTPVVSPPSSTTTPLNGTRSMAVNKTVDKPTISSAETLTYTIVVSNTGTRSLTDVVVTDVLPNGTSLNFGTPAAAGDEDSVVSSINTDAVLDVGEAWTYTLTYAVSAGEIALGNDLVNTATATTPPLGPSDSAVTTITATPSISLVKTVDVSETGLIGQVLNYTITVTNSGNVDIDEEDFIITDVIFNHVAGGSSLTPVGPNEAGGTVPNVLEVGEEWTYTASYAVQEDDFGVDGDENPLLVNRVTATITGQPPVTHDATTVLMNRRAAIVEKRVDRSSIDGPGTLNYTIVITNTGTQSLTAADLDFSDELPDGTTIGLGDLEGPTEATATLEVGDTWTFTYAFEVEQEHFDNWDLLSLVNVVSLGVDGEDPVESEVTTQITRNPRLSVEKTVDQTVISAPGTLVYTITVENIGNVAIPAADIKVVDTLPDGTIAETSPTPPNADLGAPVASDGVTTSLNVGETWEFEVSYPVTQADIDAGGSITGVPIENTVDVWSDKIPSGQPGSPDDPVTDDATTTVQKFPMFSVDKTVLQDVVSEPGILNYTITITNTGNVALGAFSIEDEFADSTMSGDPLQPVVTEPDIGPRAGDGGTADVLEAGETWTYQFTVPVTQDAIDAGGPIVNRVSVQSGSMPSGLPGGEGVPLESTATTDVLRAPALTIVKTVDPSTISGDPTFPVELEYTVTVVNIGNVNLTNVTVTDTFPDGVEGTLVNPDESDSDDDVLQVGETWVYTFGFNVSREMFEANTSLTNHVSIVTTELPDPQGSSTTTTLVRAPALSIEKDAAFADEDGNGFTNAGDVITYTFVVTNTGNVTLTNVRPVDAGPTFNGVFGAGALSAFDPISVATLEPGADAEFTATYELQQADVDNAAGVADGVSNTATATGLFGTTVVNSAEDTAPLTLGAQEPSDITIVKRAMVGAIRRGETAPFVIVVTNNSSGNAGLVTVTDSVPPGFVFVEGTATVEGTSVTPVVAGRDVIFENIALGPNDEVEIVLTLRAMATAAPGQHRNIASVTDPDGTPLAPDAHAIINIAAEAVFDCSEVIGKVFNDLNGNGYQDEGEPGLPGVRLATVRGTLITTDAFGRYSVPCAELPDQTIGSNFVLKLDTRTLPTGFTLTTENPAMLRLTAGKMSEINFGASIGRQVRIDLDGSAFVPGSADPRPELAAALDGLMKTLAEKPSKLVIAYDGKGDGVDGAARLRRIETVVRERWRAAGAPYALPIETIRRGQ